MSAPIEVLVKFYVDHVPGSEQPAVAAAILRQVADDLEKNQFRPFIRHGERLVGNVFLLDAEGRSVHRDLPDRD